MSKTSRGSRKFIRRFYHCQAWCMARSAISLGCASRLIVGSTNIHFNGGGGSGDDVANTAWLKYFFSTATTSSTCTLPIRSGYDFS